MSVTSKSARPLVLAAVMASMAMVAFEATIVSTAMPQIVGQLGGLNLYSWVFSAFLLTQTVMTVVFGKLADLYGCKPVILAGIAIFLLGSVLAGFAWSMPSMIAFRMIQGVGAGAIQPVTLTIVANLYAIHERGKIQGFLASVWALSAVLGPMLGGIIVHSLSWAWIFWINLPIGLGAAAGFIAFLHEEKRHVRPSIDFLGAGLFALAITALMVALTEASTASSGQTLAWLGLFVVCTVLFVWQERRAAEPIVSFALWGLRPIAAANGATVLCGMALMGLTSFLPMYVQGVLHRSPIVAGFALTMVMLGWPIGTTLAARMFHRFGLRRVLLTGSCCLPPAALFFVCLTPDSSPVAAAVGSFGMGLGMGVVSISSLILIQEIVNPAQRGSATASNIFSRNLGSTLGATLFGAVLNFGLVHSNGGRPVNSAQLQQLLEAPAGAPGSASLIQLALQHSLHLTFIALLVIALLVVGFTTAVPAIALRGKKAEAPA